MWPKTKQTKSQYLDTIDIQIEETITFSTKNLPQTISFQNVSHLYGGILNQIIFRFAFGFGVGAIPRQCSLLTYLLSCLQGSFLRLQEHIQVLGMKPDLVQMRQVPKPQYYFYSPHFHPCSNEKPISKCKAFTKHHGRDLSVFTIFRQGSRGPHERPVTDLMAPSQIFFFFFTLLILLNQLLTIPLFDLGIHLKNTSFHFSLLGLAQFAYNQ